MVYRNGANPFFPKDNDDEPSPAEDNFQKALQAATPSKIDPRLLFALLMVNSPESFVEEEKTDNDEAISVFSGEESEDSNDKRSVSSLDTQSSDDGENSETKVEEDSSKLTSDDIASNIIAEIFDGYGKSQHAAELIARVPQIIAHLGNKVGIQWLTDNHPLLIKFLEENFNPNLELYITMQQERCVKPSAIGIFAQPRLEPTLTIVPAYIPGNLEVEVVNMNNCSDWDEEFAGFRPSQRCIIC